MCISFKSVLHINKGEEILSRLDASGLENNLSNILLCDKRHRRKNPIFIQMFKCYYIRNLYAAIVHFLFWTLVLCFQSSIVFIKENGITQEHQIGYVKSLSRLLKQLHRGSADLEHNSRAQIVYYIVP